METPPYPYWSPSIPIEGRFSNTCSQAHDDNDEENRCLNALADMRDYAMFSRLVGHLEQQGRTIHDFERRQENDALISKIINTRCDRTSSLSTVQRLVELPQQQLDFAQDLNYTDCHHHCTSNNMPLTVEIEDDAIFQFEL